jgi:hypothetical protein
VTRINNIVDNRDFIASVGLLLIELPSNREHDSTRRTCVDTCPTTIVRPHAVRLSVAIVSLGLSTTIAFGGVLTNDNEPARSERTVSLTCPIQAICTINERQLSNRSERSTANGNVRRLFARISVHEQHRLLTLLVSRAPIGLPHSHKNNKSDDDNDNDNDNNIIIIIIIILSRSIDSIDESALTFCLLTGDM